MKQFTPTELANAQNYLLLKGHACPAVDGSNIHYYDRTKGNFKVIKTIAIDELLEEIRVLKTVPVEDYSDKSAFASGSKRLGIGYYQVLEINKKLLYREDLRIELRGLY